MTTSQLLVTLVVYSIALAAAVYFTRPGWLRAAGALAGGATAGCVMLGAMIVGNAQGLWKVPIPAAPGRLLLFYLAGAVSCSPIYLVTWRVALRFGGRGLAVCLIAVAIVGPPRDYLIAAAYPEWILFSPGIAPVLADALTYAGFVGLGHAVMRLVAGAARRPENAAALAVTPA